MNVLLSIKPEFARKILGNEKQYEFRRTKFSNPEHVDTVFMYASAPKQKVVGSFSIGNIVQAHPNELWDRFGSQSGIQDKQRFMDYFSGTEEGYAIEIRDPTRFPSPLDPTHHFDDFRPPVSFQYIDRDTGPIIEEVASAD